MELRPLTPPPAAPASPAERDTAPAAKTAATGTVDAPAHASGKPGQEQLDKAVEHINKALAQSNQGVEFSVDKDTDLTVIKVIDRETKEVLRQMPSEEALAIARQIDRTQGLLIQNKA